MTKYNSWKMMDKVDLVRKNRDDYSKNYFDTYVAEHGDKKSLESAKKWADIVKYNWTTKEYEDDESKATIHTMDNKDFTVTILDSADGSYQGGRLSFWKCKVEKDGESFILGFNSDILADVIKNSDIKHGVIQEKLMFVRKAGQVGLIHENMDAYKEATADMKLKSDMQKAKKTQKWEMGGVYKTLKTTAICFGEVWDTMEEVEYASDDRWRWGRPATKLIKRDKPVKVIAWRDLWRNEDIEDFTEFLKGEIKNRDYIWFEAGKPPARAKASQLEVADEALEIIDKIMKNRQDSLTSEYGSEKMSGRYVRVK